MIKAEISFPFSDQIVATMEITMTLKEWDALGTQLHKAWPGWELTPVIRDLVAKAQNSFKGLVP